MLGFGRRRSVQHAGADQPRRPGASISFSDRIRHGSRSIIEQSTQFLSILLLVLIVVVPAGLFIWFLFFTDVFLVQAVTVVDARDETMSEAKRIVEEQVDKLPLGKNIFFVQAESLETEILTRLPQVRTVHVARKLPGTIKVIIQEKDPSVLLLSSGDYYFVDNTGIVYEEARLENLPGVILPTVKNDDRQSEVTIGVKAVEETFISFILALQEKLPDRFNSQIGEIHIPSLAAREVHVILDNNWTILFDATRSVDSQIEVLSRLLNETIEGEERDSLERVDLRIPNRVYYKSGFGDG